MGPRTAQWTSETARLRSWSWRLDGRLRQWGGLGIYFIYFLISYGRAGVRRTGGEGRGEVVAVVMVVGGD